MANQPETQSYDAGVYQLEITDSVDGGVGAKSNAPLLALANRTAYLKKHIDDLESGTTVPTGFALLASPAFTGTPTAPTQAAGDNSTKLATTAFVQTTVNGNVSVSIAGSSTTTLTQAQYGPAIITLTGVVTANKAVVFPNITGHWQVINKTTGAFTVTLKTATGTGVVLTNGMSSNIYCDATNITLQQTDFISPALTGTPTAPTAAQFDASTQLASTEFVQRALGNVRGSVSPPLGATALGTAHWGNLILGVAGAKTWTLPLLSTVPDGTSFKFMNSSQPGTTITLVSSGADFIRIAGGPNSASEIFGPSSFGTVIKYGDTWLVVDTPRAMPYSDVFSGPNWTTQPQFDKTKALATTEFAQSIGQNFAGRTVHSATENILAADMGKLHFAQSASAITLTLPPANSVPSGAGFTIMGVAGGVATISRAGADSIAPMSTPVNSITLSNGDTLTFVSNGTNLWYVFGSSQLGFSSAFAASLTGPTCWQRLPSGCIEQWGTYVGAASGAEVVISLPVTMLAAPTDIQITYANFSASEAVGQAPVLQARASTAGSITVRNLWSNTASFIWKVKGRV